MPRAPNAPAQSNYLLGASPHAGSDANTNPLGIVYGHAYSLLTVQQVPPPASATTDGNGTATEHLS